MEKITTKYPVEIVMNNFESCRDYIKSDSSSSEDALDPLIDHLQGYAVLAASGDNDVGITLRRLDKLVMHGLYGIGIL